MKLIKTKSSGCTRLTRGKQATSCRLFNTGDRELVGLSMVWLAEQTDQIKLILVVRYGVSSARL